MWRIGIPAWGPRCVPLAANVCIPSVVAALRYAQIDAQFTIHTDQPDAFSACFGEFPYTCQHVATDSQFPTFVAAHVDVLSDARDGDCVVLLDADHLVSRETIAACARQFAAGKRMVAANGVRTLGDDYPSAGASAQEVGDFIYRCPHPITSDMIWPHGRSAWPSILYFRDQRSMIAHAFHLHPIALIARSGLVCELSIDADLVGQFTPNETHVVIDVNELAIAELSPIDRGHGSTPGPNNSEYIAEWAAQPPGRTTSMHRWFFRHTIVHRGDAADFDLTPVNDILCRLGEPELWQETMP